MSGFITLYLKELVDLENDNGNGFRLGLADYPIFDPAYRDALNRKIINHFWNREIGLETPNLFMFNLRRKMWEIMPYYNQVYESTLLGVKALDTMNVTTNRSGSATESGTGSNTSNSTVTNTATSAALNNETPQTEVEDAENYATNITNSKSAGTGTTTGGASSTTGRNASDTALSTVTGYTGPASELLLRYRATFLNTDMQVIDELRELFLTVWSNGMETLPNTLSTYSNGSYFV